MIKYVSELTGNEYETEEEARDEMHEYMDFDNYMECLDLSVSKIFEKLRDAGVNYFEIFEDEFCEAEDTYFDWNYSTIETNDEDEG